jgi:peptidoglycan/LPS O-acetylase OafA/YrhL
MTTRLDRPLRRLSFVPAFDGVRAAAVLLVVSAHLRLLAGAGYARWQPKGGHLGVDIFFVLSGFLITALLLREEATTRAIRFGAFYGRRALRLLPALLLFVGVYLVYVRVDHIQWSLARNSIVSVVFYFANWKIVTAHSFPSIAPGLAHVWSLSIEEQFYLVWPLLLAVLLGLRRKLTSAVAIATGAIATVVVVRALLLQHTAPGILYFRTDMRADSLLIGALAAQLWVRARLPVRALAPSAWIALAFLAFCAWRLPVPNRFLYYGGYTLIAAAVAVVLLAILETSWSVTRVLETRALRAIGRVSYGIYLWHYFVFYVIARHTRSWNPAGRVVIGLAITTFAVVFSWYVVERPALRLKRRLAA